jgi:hypothetical protein
MTIIAISGHRGLPASTTQLVDQAIRLKLVKHPAPQVIGLTLLADGADQLFARAVLDLDGAIEVFIPAKRYREGFPADCHPEYDSLLSRALRIHRLPVQESTSESHMTASSHMLDRADELWAVWDGKPARGYGGTADVVEQAHIQGTPVHVIWPEGAQRD